MQFTRLGEHTALFDEKSSIHRFTVRSKPKFTLQTEHEHCLLVLKVFQKRFSAYKNQKSNVCVTSYITSLCLHLHVSTSIVLNNNCFCVFCVFSFDFLFVHSGNRLEI